ncbi:MAG: twin-arginine translocation signal domain-containing protein [Fibrobacteria bacterium]
MRRIPRLLPDPVLCSLFFLFAAWAAFFISRDFRLGLQKVDDGPQYLLLAKSLLLHHRFINMAMPGVPDFLALPSAFPLMLTLYWKFIAPSELPLYLALAIVMAAGAWMAFLWLQRFLPRWQAFLIALAFTANPLFIVLASSVMTESPCIFLLYSGLWLSFRDLDKQAKGETGWKRNPEGWLALLAWLILFRLRVNAMPFLILHLASLVSRRQFLKVSAAAVLAALWLWLEKSWSLQDSQGYLHYDVASKFDPHAGVVAIAAKLVKGYASNVFAFATSAFGQLTFPFFSDLYAMDKVKRLAVLGLTAWGLWGLGILWLRHPRCRPYLIAFLFSWLPIFLQRPVSIGRYLLPSSPLFFMCLLLPFPVLAGRWGNRNTAAAAAILIMSLTVNQALAGADPARWRESRKEGRDFHDLHAFINAAERKPDLILSLYRDYSHLETGLPCIWYPMQWEYALQHGLLEDKRRIWAFEFLASPADAKKIILGGPYRLGDAPVYQSGVFTLYPVLRRDSAGSAFP